VREASSPGEITNEVQFCTDMGPTDKALQQRKVLLQLLGSEPDSSLPGKPA